MPAMPQDSLLNLEEISRFRNMLIFARTVVEGYFSGKHKSPYYGSSAEFADYKKYVYGEDLSRVDWRVYGRCRRLYQRQYEEETDMIAYLLVDTSASMSYAGPQRGAKIRQAGKIAAALAYLMLNQGDKVSLTLFDEKVYAHLPPGGTRRHLYHVVSELEAIKPSRQSGIHQALDECTSIFRKRGMLVMLSDFLGDLERIFDRLNQFVHRQFDVLILQIMDDDELLLPDVDIARFVDMETGEEVQVEPTEIRRDYRRNMAAMVDNIARQCDNNRVRYSLVNTRNPYIEAIEAYLGFRPRVKAVRA